MKNLHTILPAFLFLIMLLSCSARQESESTGSEVQDTPAQLTAMASPDLYSNGITKLIKTANYRFEVDNAKTSTEAIEIAIRKFPAFISSSDTRLENPVLENKMTIRVQNEFFHDLLKEIDKQALYVNYRDIKTEDVSKQFIDLESRLKTKREVEQRYMEILRNKAGTIEELLNAEKQIGALHEEIEATVSKINYLKDEVRYSTINLSFYQRVATDVTRADTNEISLGKQFGDALKSGWTGVIVVALGITYLWPFVVGLGIAFFVITHYRKKKLKLKV